MVNVSGFKVWPAEVEHVLYRHAAVREVAVYGTPDPLKGEQVRARGRAQGRASTPAPRSSRSSAATTSPPTRAPAQVDLVQELPKSATGKILKRVLRDQAAKA